MYGYFFVNEILIAWFFSKAYLF